MLHDGYDGAELHMSVLRRPDHGPADRRVVRSPTRPGERCELSELLIPECACRIHKKKKETDDGHRLSSVSDGSRHSQSSPAQAADLDFS